MQLLSVVTILCLALHSSNGKVSLGTSNPSQSVGQPSARNGYIKQKRSSSPYHDEDNVLKPDFSSFPVPPEISWKSFFRMMKTFSETSYIQPRSIYARPEQMERKNKDAQFRLVRQAGGLDFGELPTVGGIQSIVEIGQDTLQTFYNLVRSFVDTVRPGSLPYELITPTISELAGGLLGSIPGDSGDPSSGSGDGLGSGTGSVLISKRQVNGASGFDIQGILTNIATWFVPILIVTGLGIVLAVLFPLAGCCFCCWRCCGKCGAKNYQRKTKYELAKCATLSGLFLMAHLFLLIGIVLGFLSNNTLSNAIQGYPNTLRNALADTVNYVNGTVNQVVFLADDGLDTVFDRVSSDIQNASHTLGDPLELSLQNEFRSFLNASDQLLDNLDSVHNDLSGLNETLSLIESLSLQLDDSLFTLQETIANLTTHCMGNPVCEGAVPDFQAADVAIDLNTTPLGDALATLDAVDINGTRALIEYSGAFLNNISELIGDQLSNFDLPLNISQLQVVTSTITSVQQTVDQILSSNGAIGEVGRSIDDAATYIELGEQYRYIAFVVLFAAIFFIWLVFTIGMLCGIFGYSKLALPNERSNVSNCGARLLFLGIAICFLTCGLVLILTSLTFLLTSTMQKFCDDLAPSEYTILQRTVDDPEVWGGNTLVGSIFQSQLGINASVSTSDVLRRCEQNQPLYDALQVDTFLDINSYLSVINNLTSQFNLQNLGFGSALAYTSDDFIPAAMRADLENLASNVSGSLNFTSILQLLNSTSLDSLNLQELSNNLTVLANFYGSNNFTSAENATLSIRDNLVEIELNSTLMATQTEVGKIQSIVNSLEGSALSIGPQVRQTFAELDIFLNNTAEIVDDEVGAFVSPLLAYLTEFVDFALDQLTNEVGRCQPLTTAYRAVHNTVCMQTIDGVNGFWFSTGWCVVFLIPVLIMAAIMTSYFRKSKSDVHSFVESEKGEVISNPEFFSNRPSRQEERLTLHTPAGAW